MTQGKSHETSWTLICAGHTNSISTTNPQHPQHAGCTRCGDVGVWGGSGSYSHPQTMCTSLRSGQPRSPATYPHARRARARKEKNRIEKRLSWDACIQGAKLFDKYTVAGGKKTGKKRQALFPSSHRLYRHAYIASWMHALLQLMCGALQGPPTRGVRLDDLSYDNIQVLFFIFLLQASLVWWWWWWWCQAINQLQWAVRGDTQAQLDRWHKPQLTGGVPHPLNRPAPISQHLIDGVVERWLVGGACSDRRSVVPPTASAATSR